MEFFRVEHGGLWKNLMAAEEGKALGWSLIRWVLERTVSLFPKINEAINITERWKTNLNINLTYRLIGGAWQFNSNCLAAFKSQVQFGCTFFVCRHFAVSFHRLEMVLDCNIQIKRVTSIAKTNSDKSSLTVVVAESDNKITRRIDHRLEINAVWFRDWCFGVELTLKQ